jgi:hypothetical protein
MSGKVCLAVLSVLLLGTASSSAQDQKQSVSTHGLHGNMGGMSQEKKP